MDGGNWIGVYGVFEDERSLRCVLESGMPVVVVEKEEWSRLRIELGQVWTGSLNPGLEMQ